MNSISKPNRLIIVLVEPAGAINLGSIARLCANFDVDELRLVKPACRPNDPEAQKMAIKGKPFLENSKEFTSLIEALEDCRQVVATCGRIDHGNIPLETTDSALPWLLNSSVSGAIAIVFGREDRGLTNEELQLANKVITLNSSTNYPSLNLSHAVGIVLHELKKNELKRTKLLSNNSHIYASPKQLNDFILDAEQLLLDIGFLMRHTANARLSKIRIFLNRAEIRSGELALLRGVIRQIRWALDSKKP